MENNQLINEQVVLDFLTIKEKSISNFNENKIIPSINNISITLNDINTNYVISADKEIESKIQYLNNKISPLLISLIKSEVFEFGQKSESIKLIEEQLQNNKMATQNWFNSLYLKYFMSDDKILIGLLRIVEYFEEKMLYPVGPTMAIASLAHKNDEIKELGVRIFEGWDYSIMNYKTLKNIQVEALWLQKYINQVINDIEVELCLS